MSRNYVVRVVIDGHMLDVLGSFIRALQFSGLMEIRRNSMGSLMFDILPPPSARLRNGETNDTKNWAENTAASLQGFGFNTIVVPEGKE